MRLHFELDLDYQLQVIEAEKMETQVNRCITKLPEDREHHERAVGQVRWDQMGPATQVVNSLAPPLFRPSLFLVALSIASPEFTSNEDVDG